MLGWSPDSRLLLLDDISRTGGWLFDVAQARKVGPVGPAGCCREAGWSPDGTRFAAVVDDPHGGPTRGLIVVDSSSLEWRWLYQGDLGYASPVWSPDGESVAFTLNGYTTSNDEFPLAVMSLRTGKLTRLGTADDLTWAPGPQLVFSRPVGKDRSALYAWNGTRAVRIPVTGSASSPRWSPDGQTLAFSWSRFDSKYDDTDVAVFQDGHARRVTAGGIERTSLIGWSKGPQLPRAPALPSSTPRAQATLKLQRAALLDAVGTRVAISNPCGPLLVWDISRGTKMTIPTGCEKLKFGEVTGLALSGSRAAWVFEWTDRMEGEDCVMLADITQRIAHPITHAKCGEGYVKNLRAYHILRVNEYEPGGADYVELIAGADNSIAYSTLESSRVFLAEDAAPHPILTQGTHLLAYDGTRLVIRYGSTTRIVDALGHTVRIARGTSSEVQVLDDRVVTVDKNENLRIINARTGAVARSIRLLPRPADQPRLEDINPAYVALVADGQLRIVRLSDGRSIQVDLPDAVAPIHARFLDRALVVSYNALGPAPRGRGEVIPISALVKAFP
jgi:dipeptidyl aminopeptidase/acylaminoacyl peptidase